MCVLIWLSFSVLLYSGDNVHRICSRWLKGMQVKAHRRKETIAYNLMPLPNHGYKKSPAVRYARAAKQEIVHVHLCWILAVCSGLKIRCMGVSFLVMPHALSHACSMEKQSSVSCALCCKSFCMFAVWRFILTQSFGHSAWFAEYGLLWRPRSRSLLALI